jgi:hypothetical protein
MSALLAALFAAAAYAAFSLSRKLARSRRLFDPRREAALLRRWAIVFALVAAALALLAAWDGTIR